MGNVIHLTAAQAAQISGSSTTAKDVIVTPAALNDGTFFVGLQNIDNLAFAGRAGLLVSFRWVDHSVVSTLIPQDPAPGASGGEG